MNTSHGMRMLCRSFFFFYLKLDNTTYEFFTRQFHNWGYQATSKMAYG